MGTLKSILTPAVELDAVVVGVVNLWVMGGVEDDTRSTLRPENRSSDVTYRDDVMIT